MKSTVSLAARGGAIAAAAWFALLSQSSAVITAADPFPTAGDVKYDTNLPLVGQGPALFGFRGNWLRSAANAESPSVIGTSLSYSDGFLHSVSSLPGAITYAGAGAGRAGRVLTRAYTGATNGTVYFAFLIQLDSVGAGTDLYRGFELHEGGFDDGSRRLQIVTGEAPSHTRFTVRLFNNPIDGFTGDLGPANATVNMFVGKITLSSANNGDAIQIWRNPSNLSNESLSGAPDFSKTGFNLAFDRASVARFNGSSGFILDELRFGTAWADVTTVNGETDSDGDDLPDTWETANGLNPNDNGSVIADNGASGNPDVDGLTNIQEFADYHTDPQDPDSDDDGLNDGADVTAGGSPLDIDSDDDFLTDGAEVNTYGTSPVLADTDGDTEIDGFEVSQGTNPLASASNTVALGLVNTDGARDSIYGTALAVQTVNTQSGNNKSEWDAAYAYVKNGRLYLMLTGNLEDNFNRLEIFIDSSSAVTTNVLNAAGNDGSNALDGLTFDTGFSPDYHLIARRGTWDRGVRFDLDIANLAAPAVSFYGDVFAGSMEGSANTGTGAVNASPIGIAYNNSNTAGVTGGTAAADQTAAAAVTTGLELSIALSDLGNPSGSLRIAVMQNNGDHTYLSNQILAGLPAPQGNLGNVGSTSVINFGNFAGDQFFTVAVPVISNLRIASVQLISNNTQIQFTVEGLTTGTTYKVRESQTLAGFTDVAGTQFTANSATRTFTIPVNTNTTPKRFFQVVSVP